MAERKATPTTPSSAARRKPKAPPGPIDRVTAYARDVASGRIVAGPHVRNACRRHLQDLVDGPARGLWWDYAAAERVFAFFRGVLRLNGGQFEGIPFELHASQAFIVGSLFGWKVQHEEGGWVRRFRRAYIEQGKGNGKSPMVGGIGLFGLTADGEHRAQVFAAAAKKEQARILFNDAVAMVEQSPALSKRLSFAGGPGRRDNIAYHAKGSYFRPLSRDAGKTGSGWRPHFALADELHEHPDEMIVDMLERGFKSRRQPLLVEITNSGSDRNSFCWREREHAVRVAAGTMTPDEAFAYVGEVIDDTTFAYVCALDPGDDPLTDTKCWIKANPLLGTILTHEYLAGVVDQANKMPGKRNGILRLHFCIWTDSDEAWIGREALERVLADFDVPEDGPEPSLGLDLSGTKDLTALACVVRTGSVTCKGEDGGEIELPTFDAWVEAWTPRETLRTRALADSAPYEIWVEQGHLRATDGPRVRFDVVAAYVAAQNAQLGTRVLAFDRYAYAKFADALDETGAEIVQAEHPQGGKRKAKPTKEQLAWAKMNGAEAPDGLWMPGSLELLEQLILEGRIRIRRSPVVISACMSAAIESDVFGNRWFSKAKATQRIDPVVALAMAVGAAHAQGFDGSGKSFWELE